MLTKKSNSAGSETILTHASVDADFSGQVKPSHLIGALVLMCVFFLAAFAVRLAFFVRVKTDSACKVSLALPRLTAAPTAAHALNRHTADRTVTEHCLF